MSIYSFEPGPKYRPLTPQAAWDSALSSPLSLGTNFGEQVVGGALQSYVLGSTIRDTIIPQGNVERSPLQVIDALTPGIGMAKEAVRGLTQNFINPDQPSLSEDEWKASPSYRENIPYDPGMTAARADALAAWDDARKVREHFASKRPFSSFVGNLGGQALDPVNYVPVFGELVRAAAVARAGKIAGAALVASGDAAANTALAAAATYDTRGSFGDEVSWQGTISEIATAALIGGAFGTIGGAIGARSDARAVREATDRLSTLRTTQEARIALNEAIDGIVSGEDIRLSPNATEPLQRVQQQIVSYPTPEERMAAIDRIVRTDMPVGQNPREPISLTTFLTSKAVGGIKDEGGELAAMGLSRKFVPGGGSLVTKGGKSIEYAREAAAEAGFFDHIYGDPQTAIAKSTPDDLLRLLREEASGNPVYSDRYDGGRQGDKAVYELSVEAQESYRRALEGVDYALGKLGIDHKVDDNILRKAAEYSAGENIDIVDALERAIEEDYRAFDTMVSERGIKQGNGTGNDIPFPDSGAGPRGGGGFAQQGGNGFPGGRGADAAYREQLARAGRNEGSPVDASLARPDPIPEGRAKAESALAKAETYKATAEQHRVDPETGSYVEEAEIKQLDIEGRLTEADKADLEAAAQIHENSVAYGEALRAAAGCLI